MTKEWYLKLYRVDLFLDMPYAYFFGETYLVAKRNSL